MTIVDENTERRLIAGMLGEPCVLERCAVIETADFSDFRYWLLLGAIRKIQSDLTEVCPFAVDRLLRGRDEVTGQSIAENCDLTFMAWLLASSPPYCDERVLIAHDIAWLRELTSRRRQLEDAA